MIDPREEAIYVKKDGRFLDKTENVVTYSPYRQGESARVAITFKGRSEPYAYSVSKVRIVKGIMKKCPPGTTPEIEGRLFDPDVELRYFYGPVGNFVRVFDSTGCFRQYPEEKIRYTSLESVKVRNYFNSVARSLPQKDPLQKLFPIREDAGSALAKYLARKPIEYREWPQQYIFPFSCNGSQRKAVENALTSSLSIVEGPPGTGKTQTILNIIANIFSANAGSVGVVSFSNEAVNNVATKLSSVGMGHVIAELGNSDKRKSFFATQEQLSEAAEAKAQSKIDNPSDRKLRQIDDRLAMLQRTRHRHAQFIEELGAYKLEQEHFERHISHDKTRLPSLDKFRLTRCSSKGILNYIADVEIDKKIGPPSLFRKVIRYFQYGSTHGLDTGNIGTVLQLQSAFYKQRISEIEQSIEKMEKRLSGQDFDALSKQHEKINRARLEFTLLRRAKNRSKVTYTEKNYKRSGRFQQFIQEYPVVLSTCHSLRRSLADGYLLDYLIIDEATQVNLLAAVVALACARNLIVIGDLKQISHIADKNASKVTGIPHDGYSYEKHNILSSLISIYGDLLPRSLLVEHYRCHPMIIGFCNKMYYNEALVAYTSAETKHDKPPMRTIRTSPGNHMRHHDGGGNSNQREVDVIAEEVIRDHCSDFLDDDIGVVTPYQRQVKKLQQNLKANEKVDTIHSFQGRQCEAIVFSTVLDDTKHGRIGLKFVDDPAKLNVAISRARQRFILVTNHSLLPKSRHIRELIDYIAYQNPDYPSYEDSTIISVFDLLYREYSEKLTSLAKRLRAGPKEKSEKIIWTLLHDLVAEERYSHLRPAYQVYLRNLFPDTNARLTSRQRAYIGNKASVDFVLYSRTSNRALLGIEVDGFAYHENDQRQQEQDALKDSIFELYALPLLRLPTTGSGEGEKLRAALDAVIMTAT